MAIYRNVQIDYWQDGFVLDLTPEEKYFYIYLITNSKTTQSGIYELPSRIIEIETGYNRETIEKLLHRFGEYNKIIYSKETKEVFIKNWIKYNKINSPKVKKCIEQELLKVKNKSLIELFLKECKKHNYIIDTKALENKNNENVNDYKNIENKCIQGECSDNLNIENTISKKEIQIENVNEINEIYKYKLLYEQNVGLINGIVGEWLFEVCETIDYELFKNAIKIATDKGKCNKGYINGILKQWNENNIKTIDDLKAYEVTLKNRGENNGKYSYEHSKSKYATELENENEELYRKPTDEEIQSARLEFEQFRS